MGRYRKFIDASRAEEVRQILAELCILCIGEGVFKNWAVFGFSTSTDKIAALENRMVEAGITWVTRKPASAFRENIPSDKPKRVRHTPWYMPTTRIECPHCETLTGVPAQEFFYQYARKYTCTKCGKDFEVFIDIMAQET